MKINMKKFLICLFSFLFIGCSIAGGAVLLSNSSYSDNFGNGNLSQDENEIEENIEWRPEVPQGDKPTNDDLWTDSGNYASSFAGGDGSSSNPYQIATASQLARLAYLVNHTSPDILYCVQTADIDLSAHYWDPIGYSRSHTFVGNYDGEGRTIFGLYTNSTEDYQGLFGILDGMQIALGVSVQIKNVNIINSEINARGTVGGIVSYIRNRTVVISNCHMSGSVIGTTKVGGIVGYISNNGVVTIEDCSNSGDITNNYSSNSAGGAVGGIVGDNAGDSLLITGCYNEGTISMNTTITFESESGGIVGRGGGNITNCWNSGSVKGARFMGGISGEGGNIVNCYNTANIDTNDSPLVATIGGIVGWGANGANVNSCYNTGNISGGTVGGISANSSSSANIRNCYNTGSIKCTTTTGSAGGIFGSRSTSSIRFIIANCYNIGEVSGGRNIGGIAGSIYGSNAYIYNCYNAGAVLEDSVEHPGGIVGYMVSLSWAKCYWGINCEISSIAGGGSNDRSGFILTETNAKSLNWYTTSSNWYSSYAWDFSYTWQISSGVNNGYPTLRMLNTYIINYDSNGGSGTMSVSVKRYNESITLQDNEFTRTGYTFQGWATSSSGGVSYRNGATYTRNADITLYAVWARNTYTITYNANGGEGTMASSTKTYGVALTLRKNTFTREGYAFKGWATSTTGSVVYVDEGTYTANASDILYAVWELAVFNITIDWQLGDNENSLIYLYYDQYYADDSGEISTFDFNAIEHVGFSFGGCFTSPNGQGNMTINTNGEFVSTTITQEDDIWYCYWVANNKAYYDSDGYWYVEIGRMPQSKVDATLKSTLSSNWSSLTTGDSYYLGGTTLSSKVYNNKEYCLYNNEYYLVEPIRWRLAYSSSQTVGYGTTEDTLAIMDSIVYVGQFSNMELNAGAGYSSFAVTELKNNILETTFLANETKSMPTFGSTSLNGTAESVTSNIFVASSEEIEEVADSGKIEFSDLVKDYLMASGKDTLYYTRDLGTNYNNLLCMNGNGDKVQYKAQNYLGMQFSIVVTEYACV